MAKNICLDLLPILCAIYRTSTTIEDILANDPVINIHFYGDDSLDIDLSNVMFPTQWSVLKADKPCVCNYFMVTWLISPHIHHCIEPGDKGRSYSCTSSSMSREVQLVSQWISIPGKPRPCLLRLANSETELSQRWPSPVATCPSFCIFSTDAIEEHSHTALSWCWQVKQQLLKSSYGVHGYHCYMKRYLYNSVSPHSTWYHALHGLWTYNAEFTSFEPTLLISVGWILHVFGNKTTQKKNSTASLVFNANLTWEIKPCILSLNACVFFHKPCYGGQVLGDVFPCLSEKPVGHWAGMELFGTQHGKPFKRV